MGEGYGHHFLLQPAAAAPPPRRQGRLGGVRGGGGEIVEVEGGHIVRSTGRKDRHSKVCTANGPRDRRVRLSAHTAIQFYDVQDRLGCDRPSKAVDWLIKNARAAIDELAELPAWHPTATRGGAASNQPPLDPLAAATEHSAGDTGKRPMPVAEPVCSAPFGYGGGSGSGSGSFLPPSLDSEAIADTIKSFFPIATHSSSPPIGYRNYPQDLLSRSSSQDLRLSLQSFQDPIFHQFHPTPTNHALFSGGSAPFAFDVTPASWSEQNQRMVWNVADGGFPPPHTVLGQSQYFTQGGSLQSSNSTSVRAWAADPMLPASADHEMNPALHPSMSSIGFTSGGSFSGFRIPARIQGEEEHDGMADKPSSAPRH